MWAVEVDTVLVSIPMKRRMGECWVRRGRGRGSSEDVVEGRDVVTVDSASRCRRPVGWNRLGYKAGSRSRVGWGIGS